MNEQLTPTNPVEEQINQELVKHNVTEAIIANLQEKYMPLKIQGIEDKETYYQVKEARKECKALRVLAKKICVAGREDAVAIQKAWVAKEKEVTEKIGEVEDYLEAQEKEHEAAVEKDKADKKRKQEEQFILRQQELTNMGALYADGNFVLGEVSFELSLVRECDSDIWLSDIKPKFEEEYKKVEAERIEQDRIKQEREVELQRQREDMERKQRELEQREAVIQQAEEDRLRKEREEQDRQCAAEKAKQEAQNKARIGQLHSLGLKAHFEGDHLYLTGYDWAISHLDITGYDEEKWYAMIEKMTGDIAQKKEKAEKEMLAKIEAEKESARLTALHLSRREMLNQYNTDLDEVYENLALVPDEEWAKILNGAKEDFETWQREKWEKEQEEKRKQEEADRLAKMEAAKDKEKWDEMVKQVNALEVFDMRSSQYRTKALKFRQKLDELKAICNV